MGFETLSTPRDNKHDYDRTNEAAAGSLFEDAYSDSLKVAGSIARVAALTTGGTACGAIDEIVKDPPGMLYRAGTMLAGGAAVGAIAAFNPVAAATAGATMTGLWAWENLNPYKESNKNRYSQIGNSVRETWSRDDASSFNKNFEAIKQCTGPIALDVSLMALSPRVVNFGARHSKNFAKEVSGKLPIATLCPAGSMHAPMPRTTFSVADINFLSTRNGKVRISQGPPETIEARLAAMDKNPGIKHAKEQSKSKQSENLAYREWMDILTPPLDQLRKHESTCFWSSSKHGIFHR